MELCQCVSTLQCANVCEAPLIKDPIGGCDCLSMTDYLALYEHGLDENCLPKDDDCCGDRNINIFNFYAPVYGDVSGFADGHVSHITGECDDDHDDDDDHDHDDDDDDHHDDDDDDDHDDEED